MPSASKTKSTLFPVVMISLALALRQMPMTIVAPLLSTYGKFEV